MMDPPSGRVPEWGLDWFLVDTEACGGGTPDLGYVLEVWEYIIGFGIGNKSGGLRVSHEVGGVPSTVVVDSGLFWPNYFASGASSGPKKSP